MSSLSVQSDELLPHVVAAFNTAKYAASGDENDDYNWVLLYQSDKDATRNIVSFFSVSEQFICAAHGRMRPSTNSTLPIHPVTNDRRVYISVSNLDKIYKWLKSLPRGTVRFEWFGDSECTVRFEPQKNIKRTYDGLTIPYVEENMWEWSFKSMFYSGRCAFKNANDHRAIRQVSSFSVRPLVLRWIDTIYAGKGVDLTPFDNGNNLYICSDFFTSLEAVCSLPYPAVSNSKGRKNNEG